VIRLRPAARWRAPRGADPTVQEAVSEALAQLRAAKGRPALPEPLVRLLVARGLHDAAAATRFLRPSREHLHPAEALTDLVRAADRLAAAIAGNELIVVHGDYDVDGMCASALLTKVLRAAGGRVEAFIPDRRTDGYDLGPAGVAFAVAQGARLVLTCDCGTTALAPARALRAAGIDLIITDHHRPGPELPEAFAIVNPQREPDAAVRDDAHLAAVGVAWKLMHALVPRIAGLAAAQREALVRLVDEQLELVALATVADVAKLVGDNRVLVTEGLRQMQEPRNLGLRALIRSASLDGKRITAGRLGFTVAPRLNALGRIRQARQGVELLLEEDEGRAMDLARVCNEVNAERQALDRAVLDAARDMLGRAEHAAAVGLVLAEEGWEPGVIGIVASRIVELTHRPTFLIAVTGDGGARVGKGSGRSVPGFDLHAALTDCGDVLEKFGGHRAAAGLTIRPERIPEFRERFDAAVRARITEEQLTPELQPDLELSIEEADEALADALRFLEPFGMGNAGPVLVSRGVQVRGGPRTVGGDGLKLELVSATGPREAVGWGMAPRKEQIRRDATLDLVYRLEINEFRGARTLQANLLDFRPADG
jgi:single-stranded-DNA-specific exonuclease